MNIKPILFNTEMVRAIQGGRKTQTRRIIKLAPGFSGRQVGESGNPNNPLGFMYPCGIKRPPYNKGDILWVRETWYDPEPERVYVPVLYKADFPIRWDADQTEHGEPVDLKAEDYRWKPSIHMPKGFARIFLQVKDVRVERLKEISEEACMAEGIREWTKDGKLFKYATASGDMPSVAWSDMPSNPIHAFRDLWNSAVKPGDRFRVGWEGNPWVWVIEFERIEKPEGWCR